jgi:hypothetical protein
MNIARKGMMVYLIGNPDQVKMKILASLASSWFNFFLLTYVTQRLPNWAGSMNH